MSFTELETKDPVAEVMRYWDWTKWLAAGESIASFTITLPAGITDDNESNTANTVAMRLKGGTDGESYDCTCQIVTDATPAQKAERTFTQPVANT